MPSHNLLLSRIWVHLPLLEGETGPIFRFRASVPISCAWKKSIEINFCQLILQQHKP